MFYKLNLQDWHLYTDDQRSEIKFFLEESSKHVDYNRPVHIFDGDETTCEFMAIKYPKTIVIMSDEDAIEIF